MAAERRVIGGVVRGGVIVPEGEAELPEGMRVEIVLRPGSFPPELREEFAAWERASDDAWGMITQWEEEEQP
jgi:hypothetical protein